MPNVSGKRREEWSSGSDSSPSLRRFLTELSDLPRITAEQEKRLGRRIRRGDAAAIQALVVANLCFVVSYAKRFRGCGLPFVDLINEGNAGLIEAARRFDPDKNVKFITYAVWWVRQAIVQAISDQARPVRLPQKAANQLYRIRKAINALTVRLQRRPTVDEVARAVEVEAEVVRSLLLAAEDPVSLTEVTDDENEFTVLDRIGQDRIPSPDAALLEADLRQQVGRALTELDHKERLVIRLRFGLHGERRRTLKEIGETMGLSRERVRQIESAALAKLRGSRRWQQLRSYLN